MMDKFDLNSDMGESFGWFKHGVDEEIIKSITSANLACGFHGGDPSVMRNSVELARDNGVAVGAHPGFPDLIGFGRRNMDVKPAEVKDYVTYQVGALQAFCRAAGVPLQHVKPHGALYMMVLEDEGLAEAVADSILKLMTACCYTPPLIPLWRTWRTIRASGWSASSSPTGPSTQAAGLCLATTSKTPAVRPRVLPNGQSKS